MANYISDKTDDPSVNVETLILHDNDCCDQSFAAILDAMNKQKQLKNLTYSLNTIGLESLYRLDFLFDFRAPYNL